MRKSILSLGKVLSKEEQQHINGGGRPCSDYCYWNNWVQGSPCRNSDCHPGICWTGGVCILH